MSTILELAMLVTIEDALVEYRVKFDAKPEYFSVLCPFHDDTNPSATIHRKTGLFSCFTCRKRASFPLFLAKILNVDLFTAKKKLGARSDCKHPIAPSDIEREYEHLQTQPQLLEALAFRGINQDIIAKYRLGARIVGTETRVTIPVINDVGEYATERLYLPGAKDRKFLNLQGKDRQKIRMFPIEQLEYDSILVCGGEMKAALGAYLLNRYDIGAVAPTCGENVWPGDCTEYFRNKLVYINCDDDETGRKYAEMRCRILRAVAREVHKVDFDSEFFSAAGVTKGDINDFHRLGGDLYQLLLKAPEWILIPGGEFAEELPQHVPFRAAFSHENVGKRVQFSANVNGISENNYLAPSVIEVKCSRSNAFCHICDVYAQGFQDSTEMKIEAEHSALLSVIGEKTEDHSKAFRKCFNIPSPCKECCFQPREYYSVTEVTLDEPLDPTAREEPQTKKIGYLVDTEISTDSSSFTLTGRLYPMPRNQMKVFLASKAEHTKDTLDAYIPAQIKELSVFQPPVWTLEAIEEKFDNIYEDIEANVTHIWQRRDYHVAIGLAYHSVLYLDLLGNQNINGWVELLIVGDTGQGKSHALNKLQSFFGLGYKVDCKSVSHAGLTIGLEKYSGKRFAVYGVLPRNDRKLVILEELKGMNPKVFQALTETRSSGSVQISKIEHKTRPARVRLIAVSNPPDSREVNSYTFGIEAAVAVIGTNEDLRRFDLVQIHAKTDITDLPELQNPPQVSQIYNADLFQKLILKAWKCEKVVFEDVEHLLAETNKLVEIFGYGPPVLDKNSSHIKIAKLSAAAAAHTCSYSDNETLLVRKCHVEFVVKYLTRVYSSLSMKLHEKSASVKRAYELITPNLLIEHLKHLPNVEAIVDNLARMDVIDHNSISNLIGDFMSGAALFAKLIQCNAIIRVDRNQYTKNPAFTKLLRETQWGLEPPPNFVERSSF